MSRHPQTPPSVLALVHRDLGRAVRDAACHTLSPYLAAHRLDIELAPLRSRIDLLAQRRPDLLDQLAEHWGTRPDPADLGDAVTRHAHLLLVRRHAHAAGDRDLLATPLPRSADAAAARLASDQTHTPPRPTRQVGLSGPAR
ncbi:hypothetical protein [Phycicoccus flavus]|uniref:hypothetical protein n=1 Tax=Phycicoccus flavus TaxID=2502783 RepID=UPI000FEB6533|nr:hypothetical protein [Phycicoccus flavus]NHA68774.1 hypothetical protein [Phycicoccus flavus]